MINNPAFADIREAMENHEADFEGGEAEEAAHSESGGLDSGTVLHDVYGAVFLLRLQRVSY